jgi:dinuclear metal center YbgI/SA1388 family protein
MELKEIISLLNTTLNVAAVEDKWTKNGLQVEGAAQVETVGFAVDASLATFEALESCQLIVVHHGLFWPSTSRITGNLRARIKFLVERDISLYSVHIPLDIHPAYGNNAGLLNIIGGGDQRLSGIAMTGDLPVPLTVGELQRKINEALNVDSKLLHFGPENVSRVTACSGGGSSCFDQAVEEGAQLFLTGEEAHSLYHSARENGIHVIFAGHYATETLGVLAIRELVESSLGLGTRFASHPTDL